MVKTAEPVAAAGGEAPAEMGAATGDHLAPTGASNEVRLGVADRSAISSADVGGIGIWEGDNTRVPSARWPPSVLAQLPAPLRPEAGQTLDLILRKRVLLRQSRRGYRANTDSMLLPYFAAWCTSGEGVCGADVAAAARATGTGTGCSDGGPSGSDGGGRGGSGGRCGGGRGGGDDGGGASAWRAVADLGCGNGLVGILAALQWPTAVIDLFEVQPQLARLAQCNLALNGLAPPPRVADGDIMAPPSLGGSGATPCAALELPLRSKAGGGDVGSSRATVQLCDLADRDAYPHAAYDIALCNPPYYEPLDDGRPRKGSAEKEMAWIESTLTLQGFVSAKTGMLLPTRTLVPVPMRVRVRVPIPMPVHVCR